MKRTIAFNKPFVTQSDKKFIDQVFKKKNFSDGFFQKGCENLIKKKIKSKYIALTQNCSSALEISMILLDLNKGDEVIMPSYTFTSTANAVILRGAKPVFVDVNSYDANLNPKLVEKKINKKTNAIVLVHYGGNGCDMSKFMSIKKKYNLFIIEDAAHAFLGKYRNKYLGTFGDFGTFSFHETKNYVGGQCGAISINNTKFINRAKIILDKGTDRSFLGDRKKYYSWKDVGSEFRSAELPAALLFSQLVKHTKIESKRSKIWNHYYKNFSRNKSSNYYIISKDKKNKSAHHLFALVFKNRILRKNFINFMKKRKIICHFHYYPLHMSSFGKKISKAKLPNTEKIYNGLVRLPLYPSLQKFEINNISKSVESFLKKN